MKMPLAVGLIAGVVFIAVLVLSVPAVRLALVQSPAARPVVMQALGNYTDSEEHAKYFLYLIRLHQYAQARSLLTPDARKSLSTPVLQGEWAAFESVHGRVTQWTEGGGTDNLLPEYVERRYQVSGSRGSAGLVTLRLTRSAGSWLVDSLTISR